jgi:hypothetical protein
VSDRSLIYWYRTGCEHRVANLEKSAAAFSHHLKFLQPGSSLEAKASERNEVLIKKLRSTAIDGLEWLAANQSPEDRVNVAFRRAWECYVEAADVLTQIDTGIMTAQEYADRSRDAWGDARWTEHCAMETFSEAVAPALHPGNV